MKPPPMFWLSTNDPDRSAESLVAQFADQGVVYANEPGPGIATARNRAMKAAPILTSLSSSMTM